MLGMANSYRRMLEKVKIMLLDVGKGKILLVDVEKGKILLVDVR